MKKRVKSILIAFAVIVVFPVALSFLIAPGFARSRAELSFTLFREDFERAVRGEDITPPGVAVMDGVGRYVDMDYPGGSTREGVDFRMGGWGFGSQTSYYGIVYAAEDEPLGFQCVEVPLRPEEGGWLWEESGGDNWQRVVKLDDHWYYYEMHF